MRQFAIHMMDYVDTATTIVLSPDILPLEDQRNMLRHIESKLPSTMHLPSLWITPFISAGIPAHMY